MNPKAEKLLPKIEKAGIKASLKAGHALEEEELKAVKIQLMPTLYRWGLGGISASNAYSCYLALNANKVEIGLSMGVLSALFLFFGIYGIRRTLGSIIDHMPADIAGELMEAAVKGIYSIVEGLFD